MVSSAEKVNFAACSNAWQLLFLAFMMLFRFLTVGLLLSSVSLHAQNVTTDSTLVDSTKTIDLREVVVSQKVVQHKANKDVYTITPQIREGAFTAIDLLK